MPEDTPIGEGVGIDTPLDVPLPPGLDEATMAEIVESASELIERDFNVTPRDEATDSAANPDPTDAADASADGADDGDDDADPPAPQTPPGSDTSPRPLASEPGEEPSDPDPAPEAAADPDPDPAPDPTPAPSAPEELDDWERVGRAWENLAGQRPTFEDLTTLQQRASHYDTLINQLQSLPPDQSQVVAAIVEGRFDPAEYAQQVLASNSTPNRDPAAWDDDPDPRHDPVVGAINDLRSDFQRQQQAEQQRQEQAWNQHVQSELGRLNQDLIAANPHLSQSQLMEIAANVNRAGVWTGETTQTGDPYNTYRRHFLAHATASGVNVADPAARPAAPAPAPAAPPTPANTPASPTPEDVEKARGRQAAAGALAGSSQPSRSRRRSAIPNGSANPDPASPRTPADLERELAAEVERMVGG